MERHIMEIIIREAMEEDLLYKLRILKENFNTLTIAVSIGITGRNFTVMWEGYGIVPQNYLDVISEGRWTTYLDNSGWHTLADMSTEGYKFQLA